MGKAYAPKSLQEIRVILAAHKADLQKDYGVTTIGIFGSYVRRGNKSTSDIDILIDLEISMGFFKFLRLERHLSQLLGIRVDLVTRGALKPFIGERILAEIQYV